MKKQLIGISVTVLATLTLTACGSNSNKESSSSSSSESGTSKPTIFNENPYAKHKISNGNGFPKSGDYRVQDGVTTAFLTKLIDIPSYEDSGLKFTNMQYWSTLSGKLNSDQVQEIAGYSDDQRAVFDDSSSDLKTAKYIVALTLETDITNTTDQTLTFDSLSGYSDGSYDWTVSSNNSQIERNDVIFDDQTGVDVQGNKTVEDKDLTIILATGKTAKEALAKIPSGTLNIKTAGVEDSDYNQMGGNKVIQLKLPDNK